MRGEAGLSDFDRGGLEVLDASLADFSARLTSENHTLKRALADPRLFSGIGNAYSDELLHRARLSPVKLTRKLTSEYEEHGSLPPEEPFFEGEGIALFGDAPG